MSVLKKLSQPLGLSDKPQPADGTASVRTGRDSNSPDPAFQGRFLGQLGKQDLSSGLFERSQNAESDPAESDENSDLGKILITAEQISERVQALGREIDKDFADEIIQILVVLDGGWMFASDLARAIRGKAFIHFIKASSYGNRTTSSGHVRIKGGINFNLKGEKVIVVDDIVDTGRTAEALLARLNMYDIEKIRFAAFLSKPSRRLVPVNIDYLGFEIPNHFVVGYGMDYQQSYRHLPNIHVINAEIEDE